MKKLLSAVICTIFIFSVNAQCTSYSVLQASPFVAGMNVPQGMVMDDSGNLFVTNSWDNTVKKITPAGVVSSFVTTGLNSPFGITTDSTYLYVTNQGDNTISKIPIATGVASTLATYRYHNSQCRLFVRSELS